MEMYSSDAIFFLLFSLLFFYNVRWPRNIHISITNKENGNNKLFKNNNISFLTRFICYAFSLVFAFVATYDDTYIYHSGAVRMIFTPIFARTYCMCIYGLSFASVCFDTFFQAFRDGSFHVRPLELSNDTLTHCTWLNR